MYVPNGYGCGYFADFFSFTAWIFYGMAMLSLLVMRKTRAKDHRPFKVSLVQESLLGGNCV